MPKTNRGPARLAKNGSARADLEGHRLHRVDLRTEELEILVKACRRYGVSLPSYLASVQDDVMLAQALMEKFGDLIAKGAD